MKLAFHPLTLDRWPDIVQLFGERGACGGCWCMAWKLKRSHFHQQKGAGNKKAFEAIVASGEVPGLLAYDNGRAIAWCAIEPREKYPVLENSRILKRVDDQPVWSIVCLFVDKAYRRKGVSAQLIKAAADYAEECGARLVEGYPHELKKDLPDAFVWTGLASAFRQAGFVEVARR